MDLAPREYVELPEMPEHWRVLDIGPGQYPLKRANVFLDRNRENLKPMQAEGIETIAENLEEGLPMIPDKSFDYVWCSHVLEHVQDPAACAATISRIGKAGTMVVPSAIKESIFNFEEAEHQWLVLPHPNDEKPPIFIRHNRNFIRKIIDKDVQKSMCFLYRTGSNHDCTVEQYLRTWFANRERDLDIVVHWQGELKFQVIG
jgi:ubiquinone/menaquinone biosynthesis C-methylase UbiE